MVRKLLENRVAIISGGARGIGKAISISLAKQGCNIIIIDPGYSIDGKKIENKNISNETAEKISYEYRVNAKSYPTDITRYQEVKNIFQETKESFGTIDIIVNNAAILRDSFIFKLEEKNWKKVIETNLSGSFNLISCGSKIMREHKKANEEYNPGRILNIISSSGIWGNYGQAAYASAKAGYNPLRPKAESAAVPLPPKFWVTSVLLPLTGLSKIAAIACSLSGKVYIYTILV